jgi:hypothetical protein
MHTFFNPNAPFPTWQQFLKRPDNIGLNVMQAKQKYLTEQTNYYRMMQPGPMNMTAVAGAGAGSTGYVPYTTKAINFDGINDGITFDSSISGNVTISMWLKFNSINSSINTQNFVLATNATNGYALWLGSNSYIKVGNTYNFTAVTTAIQDIGTDTWFHFAFKVFANGHPTAKQGRVFINGEVIENSPANQFSAGGISFQRIAYGHHASYRYPFAGSMDELAGFSTVLTDDEIKNDLYNNGVPKDISSLNPIMHYRMGELSDGSTIVNQGSESRSDGTLINGASIITNVPT